MLCTHISSGAGTIGQLAVKLPSALSLNPRKETEKKQAGEELRVHLVQEAE
jgi:hypothetical protein